jgi:hypothetical protein
LRLLLGVVAIAVVCGGADPLAAAGPQYPADYRAPRTPDGKPDLNGIWQALGTADRDLEAHSARMGPVAELGALGAVPAGLGVVEGGEIPYQPWAAEKRNENRANWLKLDPAVKCYMPGIPRATYMPFPFEITQTPDAILMTYEFSGASRIVYMNRPDFESPADMWMGHSRGHWEGETLVIEVTSQVPETWFDSAGNFHGDRLHVVERYTAKSPYHLLYEATIEDPSVFTRPWKISLPLYRRVEPGAQLLEFKCIEFAEELLYGHLRRPKPEETPSAP